MAKLPTLKRLNRDDIKGAPGWANVLLTTINSFMDYVFKALDKDLTFEDNFSGTIVTLEYTGGDTLTVGSPLNRPVVGILLLSIQGEGLTAANSVQWRQIGQDIEITSVPGTTNGNVYSVKLLIV